METFSAILSQKVVRDLCNEPLSRCAPRKRLDLNLRHAGPERWRSTLQRHIKFDSKPIMFLISSCDHLVMGPRIFKNSRRHGTSSLSRARAGPDRPGSRD